MKGRRVTVEPVDYEPGDYGQWKGYWFCRPPWQHAGGCLGNGVTGHKVTEHEDGTITAVPSIRITTHMGEWHGYLERGEWLEL